MTREGDNVTRADSPMGSSVVMVVLDTLRADALDPQWLSSLPTLSKLVDESFVFSRAYSPSHWTLPSHASLFTGLPPTDNGAHPPNMKLREDVRTIAEVFRERNYFTACLTCNPILSDSFGLTRGFDVVWRPSRPWKASLGRGRRLLERLLQNGNREVSPLAIFGEKFGTLLASAPQFDNGARETVNYTMQMSKELRGSAFLVLNLMEAHFPYHGRGVLSSWRHRLRNTEFYGSWDKIVMAVMGGRLNIPERKRRILEQIYWENVKYLDSQLASFLAALPEEFLSESFLIVVSDHGQLLGERGKIGHSSGLDEELIRVPLIIRPPGGGARKEVSWPVDISMLFFLLDSIASHDSHALESWLKLIREQDLVFSEAHAGLVPHLYRFAGHDGVHRADLLDFRINRDHSALACVAGRWKLICHLGRKEDELYDLNSNESEEVNLVTRESDVTEELHKRLATRFASAPPRLDTLRYIDSLPFKTKRTIAELILKETFETANRPALLWTGGKDSMLVLSLALETASTNDQDPPQLVFIDHGQHFDETWILMDELVKREGLKPIIVRNDDFLEATNENPDFVKLDILNAENQEEALRVGFAEREVPVDLNTAVGNHLLKTVALNRAIREKGFDFVITGIRWDENPARSVEVFFSPRDQPAHTRVHPILPWTESEVWRYTLESGVPIHPLYQQGYRSFDGIKDSKPTSTIPAWEQDLETTEERAGRAQDKEEIMERLRSLGYF